MLLQSTARSAKKSMFDNKHNIETFRQSFLRMSLNHLLNTFDHFGQLIRPTPHNIVYGAGCETCMHASINIVSYCAILDVCDLLVEPSVKPQTTLYPPPPNLYEFMGDFMIHGKVTICKKIKKDNPTQLNSKFTNFHYKQLCATSIVADGYLS